MTITRTIAAALGRRFNTRGWTLDVLGLGLGPWPALAEPGTCPREAVPTVADGPAYRADDDGVRIFPPAPQRPEAAIPADPHLDHFRR
jgi:hypothetical protein